MNKFLTSFRFKAFFALAFVMLSFVIQTKAQVVTEVLNRVEAHRKSLTTLRSDIKMAKYNAQLKEMDPASTGKILLVAVTNEIKEAYFRLDWKTPREETITVAKGKYTAYTPSLNQASVGSANTSDMQKKSGGALAFLSMKKKDITDNYATTYIGEEKLEGDNTLTWHLSFSPKSAASKYTNAEIWVDANGMILQIKVVPESGDWSYVRLSHVEKNVNLVPSQFEVKLPKNVKIVKV
jgi:outer membrane lipoprotein-sorting protein